MADYQGRRQIDLGVTILSAWRLLLSTAGPVSTKSGWAGQGDYADEEDDPAEVSDQRSTVVEPWHKEVERVVLEIARRERCIRWQIPSVSLITHPQLQDYCNITKYRLRVKQTDQELAQVCATEFKLDTGIELK